MSLTVLDAFETHVDVDCSDYDLRTGFAVPDAEHCATECNRLALDNLEGASTTHAPVMDAQKTLFQGGACTK